MRDMLIELLGLRLPIIAINEMGSYDTIGERALMRSTRKKLADHLLANGVIVPPCKVGDSLWNIHYNRPKEWKVVYIGFNGEEWHINVHWSDKDHFVTREIDGKCLDRMFFRTKEEADQALKEREQSDL